MDKKKEIKAEGIPLIDGQLSTLKIEITSNKSLLTILDDWKKVRKVIFVLFILVFAIFVALTFVIIAIKRIYPYNDIKVNAFGATTMQNEDKEVIYWLFNAADLWANSGIEVEAGDILTIRASGRSHTAIHHLVDDAEKNKKLRDNWVNTDGEGIKKDEKRDSLRANFRIFKNKVLDALLMQVVPNDKVDFLTNKSDTTAKFRQGRDQYLVFENVKNDKKIVSKIQNRRDDFYYIGKERIDLLIHNHGILHFAVNDIVLTDSVINKMRKENDNLIKEEEWKKFNEKFFNFGAYPEPAKTNTKDRNEMTYYLEKHYYNAWYDDNVGSFLIVIERKTNK